MVALAGAAMAFGVGAGPAVAADSQITADPTASTPSAYGGIVAWSRKEAKRDYRLVTVNLATGIVADANAKSSMDGFEPDVGPDSSGSPVVVWSRCRHVNYGCDIHRYKPSTEHDTVVGAVSTSDRNEVDPVQWKGRYVFRRCAPPAHDGPVGCRGRTRDGGPTRGVGQLNYRRSGLKAVTPTIGDLRGNRLIYATETDNGDLDRPSAIRAVNVGFRHDQRSCAIDTNSLGEGDGASVFNPVYDGSRVYWREFGDRGNLVLRTDGTSPCGADHEKGSREVDGTIALTDATLIYTNGSGVYRAADPPVSYSPDP